MKIPIKRFDQNFDLPQPEPGAACFDFICRETVTVPPGKIKAIPQNVAYQIPKGYAILMFSRSSTAVRKGLMLANSVGVIDPFYRGDDDENLALVLNITNTPVTVEAGDKIAQGMLIKTEAITWDEKTAFNDKGHGGYNHDSETA